jgi:hypothetical protein
MFIDDLVPICYSHLVVNTPFQLRFIVTDKKLRDLILMCYNALDLVSQRMDYVRLHHRLRPKQIWRRTIHKCYTDWYKLVYGHYRRLAEAFLNSNKPSLKYRSLENKDLQVIVTFKTTFIQSFYQN